MKRNSGKNKRTLSVATGSFAVVSVLLFSALLTGCPSKGGSPSSPAAPTNTPVPMITSTPTNSATITPTGTASSTATKTATPTNSGTPTNSATVTPTATFTFTPSNTATFTLTLTPTHTPTSTSTSTPCGYPGNTCTYTVTLSPTATWSPTVTLTVTLVPNTPTTGPTPGVDLTFSVWSFTPPSGSSPLVAYVSNSLTNPTYTSIQTSTTEFYDLFNFNIPTADNPVYLELIYPNEGVSYPSTGPIQPHVGDSYGYYQAAVTNGGQPSFVCYSTAVSWAQGNIPVTTGTTANLGQSLEFGASNWGGVCTQTGFAGTVTLTTGQPVNSSHQLYMAAYPDNTYNRGGGTASNSGKVLMVSSSSVNGAWLELQDTPLAYGTYYWVQVWYDAGGQDTGGCVNGAPCPHEGDPIIAYGNGLNYNTSGFWAGAENIQSGGISLTSSSLTYSCSALGTTAAGTSIVSPNTGGLLFLDMQYLSGATVNQLTIDLPTGTGHYEAGIYNSFAGPCSVMGETGYQTATTAGWNTANLNTTVTLAPNTEYYIGFYTDTNFAAGPSSLLDINTFGGDLIGLDTMVSGWTPAGTSAGVDYLPSYSHTSSGVTSYPGGSTPFPSWFFASIGVPCD